MDTKDIQDLNEPAFPRVVNGIAGETKEVWYGMTLRDYFAAKAPTVPDWFKHEATKPRPVLPDVPAHFTAKERDELSQMSENLVNIIGSKSLAVESFWDHLGDVKREIDAWRNEQRELKFFKWSWYYADMMLAERAK